jgi:hypothetical protein
MALAPQKETRGGLPKEKCRGLISRDTLHEKKTSVKQIFLRTRKVLIFLSADLGIVQVCSIMFVL